MVTAQCIVKSGEGACSCDAPASLSDRTGDVFPVVREFGCRNVIYNAHKLYLADKLDDLSACGLWAGRCCSRRRARASAC
jgi:putative protease